MGAFCDQVTPAGDTCWFDFIQEQPLFLFVANFHSCSDSGVPEQTPELGVGSVPAHWPRHGHGEHPAFCWLQQAEHYSRGESMKAPPAS